MAENEEDNGGREISKRRMEELQRMQQDNQIKNLLNQILDPPAFERLLNVRLSNPELYYKVAQLLIMLQQEGKLKKKVDEPTLKALLSKIIGQRRESKISFDRK
jgi:DNA-binding TFAR19-related protein (PDSD5 family)